MICILYCNMVFADVLYAFLCLFWVEGTPYFVCCGCLEFNLRVERIGDSQFWTISELRCHFAHGLVQIKDAIFKTLIANGMFDNAHIRLTLTRGKKVKYRSRFTRMLFLQYVICYLLGITCFLILFTGCVFQVKVTSGMSPAFNLYGCALIGIHLSVHLFFLFSFCIHVHFFPFATWVHFEFFLKKILKCGVGRPPALTLTATLQV